MRYSNASFKTDKFVRSDVINACLGGDVARLCDTVKRYQIYDRTLWNRLVSVFKYPADAGDDGWRCEYWGKMMRGASSVYAYTHDEELYNILKESVEALLSTLTEDGRISTYSRDHEFTGWDMWGRKYVLLGLQYFCEVCPDEELIARCEEVMCRHLDCIIGRTGRGIFPISYTSYAWLGANSCSILEPVLRLYNRTGKQEYLDYAEYIVDVCYGAEGPLKIFAEAYEDKLDPHEYCENKAYETMSCFEGLIEYYRTVGGEKHLIACRNFARRVLESEVSLIGCSGCTHELFDNTRLHQVDPEFDGVMQETCVSVTWMKLCGQLLRLTGDSAYADAIEQTFFNAYLGAANFEGRQLRISVGGNVEGTSNEVAGVLPFDSYSPLRAGSRGQLVGGFKMFVDATFYGCCACIGAMGIGTYTETAALHSEDGIVINSYVEGSVTLDTSIGKVTYKTTSRYPYDGKICIEFDAEGELSVSFRIPKWSRETSLKVNCETVAVKNGYNKIERNWHKGDVVEICLDDNAYAVLPPEDSAHKDEYIAVRKGAVILALDSRVDDPERAIDLAFDESGKIDAYSAPCEALPYYGLSLKVKQGDGSEVHFVDYASAGSTFSKESVLAAWVKR